MCTPECLRMEISACGCGICVIKYCGGCPIPFACQFMVPCCGKCYTDCDDEGYWTRDENTIDAKCGAGYVREGTSGADSGVQEMER